MTQLDAKTEDNNMIDQGCEQKMNFKYCNISIFQITLLQNHAYIKIYAKYN